MSASPPRDRVHRRGFSAGTCLSLAMAFNTLRIEREPELPEPARRFGSPELAG